MYACLQSSVATVERSIDKYNIEYPRMNILHDVYNATVSI